MIDNHGEDVTTSSTKPTTAQPVGSHALQMVVICFVGIYLFGVVFLYANFPWLAVTVIVVAIVIMFLGYLRRLRNKATTSDE